MKSFFLILFCSLSVFISGGEIVDELGLGLIQKCMKIEAIKKSQYHKQEGIKVLIEAEKALDGLPNFENRQHLNALIAGIIRSTVQRPKEKIITIGLYLISSLIIEYSDQYSEMRKFLIKADYHFELSTFYNELTFGCEVCCNNQGYEYYYRAFDCLALADCLCDCIDDIKVKSKMFILLNELRLHMIDGLGDYTPWIIHSDKAYLVHDKSSDILYDWLANCKHGELCERIVDDLVDCTWLIYYWIWEAENFWEEWKKT